MSENATRWILLRGGRTSMRLWIRAGRLTGADLPDRTRKAYDHLADSAPWPERGVLRMHLAFSVLPGAALYTALRAQGLSEPQAAAEITRVLTRWAEPRARVLRAVTRTRIGRRVFLRAAAGSLRAFPPPGWQATWGSRSPQRVAFTMTTCYDLDMLRHLGAGAIAPAYCAVDDVLYGRLDSRMLWRRTGTLATGADGCDFCFERCEQITTGSTGGANTGAGRTPVHRATAPAGPRGDS